MRFRSRTAALVLIHAVLLAVAVWAIYFQTAWPRGRGGGHALTRTGYPVYWAEVQGPLIGYNLAVPACIFLAALSLPSALVGRRKPVARTVFMAGAVGLLMAGLEGETAHGGWKRGGQMTPFFAHPPGSWLGKVPEVGQGLDKAAEYRWKWLGTPFVNHEVRWWFSTRLTIVGMLGGALIGVIAFRPLRRSAAGPSATPPAPGTTPPPGGASGPAAAVGL